MSSTIGPLCLLSITMHQFPDPFSIAKDPEYDTTARSMSSFNDHHGDLSPTYLNDNIRCYSYIVKDFGIRTNTVRDLCKANRLVRTNFSALLKFFV